MASVEHAQKLRQELKKWETAFAAEHGRKPSRSDIKRSPDIGRYGPYWLAPMSHMANRSFFVVAAKYKEYSKFRDTPSASAPARTTRHAAPQPITPRKIIHPSSSKVVSDPKASSDSVRQGDPFRTPSHRNSQGRSQSGTRSRLSNDPLQTPTNPSRTIIGSPLYQYTSPLAVHRIRFGKDGETVGPTPQKTGKVLGLFESIIDTTPPKFRHKELKDTTNISGAPEERSDSMFETPRKRKLEQGEVDASPSTRATLSASRRVTRSGATIVSDGETPKKRRFDSQDLFATPSFLRRTNSRIMDPSLSSPPVPQPMKRPGLVKGLSSLMAELRKRQDEILDEDMDILREVEMERMGVAVRKPLFPKGIPTGTADTGQDVGVSSAVVNSEKVADKVAEDGEGKTEDEAPARVWKKKGLKRQTRRVKSKPSQFFSPYCISRHSVKLFPVRPVRSKPAAPSARDSTGDDSESNDEHAPVKKSTTKPNTEAEDGSDEDEASNYSGSEVQSDAEPLPKEKPIGKIAKKKPAEPAAKTAKGNKGKRAATTGANYCKLKIRTSTGMKGRGGGFGGRGRGGARFSRKR